MLPAQCSHLSMFLKILHLSSRVVSWKAKAAWWLSSTAVSLYKMASSLPALHRNELVLPGWSTSWMVAAMRAATSSTGSKVCCKGESFQNRGHGPGSRDAFWRVFLLPFHLKGKITPISEKSTRVSESGVPTSPEQRLHVCTCKLGTITDSWSHTRYTLSNSEMSSAHRGHLLGQPSSRPITKSLRSWPPAGALFVRMRSAFCEFGKIIWKSSIIFMSFQDRRLMDLPPRHPVGDTF